MPGTGSGHSYADDRLCLPLLTAAEAMAAWSTVHGIAVLWLQGNLPFPPDPKTIPGVIAQLGIGLRTVAVASAAHLANDAGSPGGDERLSRG